MNSEHLESILKLAGARIEKDGWLLLPDRSAMTLHVAHDGASMTVPRIEALKRDGELVVARNPRRELFVFLRSDVFAISLETDSIVGQAARRAGFG